MSDTIIIDEGEIAHGENTYKWSLTKKPHFLTITRDDGAFYKERAYPKDEDPNSLFELTTQEIEEHIIQRLTPTLTTSGYLFQYPNRPIRVRIYDHQTESFMDPEHISIMGIFNLENDSSPWHEITQYTPWNDIKHNQIAEGDIIRDEYGELGYVIYNNGFGVIFKSQSGPNMFPRTIIQKSILVGNKWETPELLKEIY